MSDSGVVRHQTKMVIPQCPDVECYTWLGDGNSMRDLRVVISSQQQQVLNVICVKLNVWKEFRQFHCDREEV